VSIITSRGPRPTVQYLFVDGGYLRGVLKEKSERYFSSEEILLDYGRFLRGYKKTFYYDCLPAKKTGETMQDYENRVAQRIEFYNSLRALNGFHVFLGSTSGEGGKARQKGVDIMIAVHMMTHSFRDNMENTTLLTGDLDFKPLIDALVQDGMDVTLWFDSASTSKELVYAADSQKTINILSILAHTKPEFQKKYPYPKASTDDGPKAVGFAFVRSGVTNTGEKVELFQNEQEKLIVRSAKDNPAYYHNISHPDLDFIEKILEECYKIAIKWS
jgi:uncharacterized LabA/DUF88 family protein